MIESIASVLLSLAASLAMTIIIEGLVGLLLGFRVREEKALLYCNLITNPVLNLISLSFVLIGSSHAPLPLILALEICVVFIESRLLSYQIKMRGGMLLISFILNAASYTIGILLFGP